jgi:large subunit ribosomal protein L5
MPRLQSYYHKEVVPELQKRLGARNPHAVPKLLKIVISMGVSEAKENIKALDAAAEELAAITGQKPETRRAKKSISNFKLRQGMPIGLRVTLHRERMYEFLDRFINTSVPRIRDFRGLNPRGFDGRGNYNLGLQEQHIFPEINMDKSEKVRGMNITFVTTAENDEHSRELLTLLGFPFRKPQEAASPKAVPAAAPVGS